MKQLGIYALLILSSFIIRGYAMETSHPLFIEHWINFQEPKEHFTISFPHQPVQMQFNLMANDAIHGHLRTYCVSLDQGVLMANTISSPAFSESLSEEKFREIFYSCLIRRLFYQPHLFKNQEAFKVQQSSFDTYPAFRFSFSGGEAKHVLSGLAVLKDHLLYVIFYMAAESESHQPLFQHFIQSFKIN